MKRRDFIMLAQRRSGGVAACGACAAARSDSAIGLGLEVPPTLLARADEVIE